MPPSDQQPLFTSDRPSSTHSEERAAAEDDALLGNGRKSSHTYSYRKGFWKDVGLFVWAVLATAAVIVLAVLLSRSPSREEGKPIPKPGGKKNLIFMVSDGMGPATLSLSRSFRQFQSGLPYDDVLVLDQYLIGSSRTRSNSSLITDSAAGATAFGCGMKTYNGAIAMLPDHTPCGTVLEAAKKMGYMTGLVVTTDITDATPASFASHVNVRTEEDLIALQEVGEHPLGRVVDLLFGGGRCHFLPNTTTGSCRADDRDITKLAKERYGWNYIRNRKEFDSLEAGTKAELPLLGLFANTDLPYEIDRRNVDTYPSLDEMARTALKALEIATQDSDQGFFLMIEGSRIDHAAHRNDPAAHVHECLAYDKAFASVVEFLGNSKTEGMVISTSDHETGGLSVARQNHQSYPRYRWYPEVLANASSSASHLARLLNVHITSPEGVILGEASLKKYINEELVKKGLGILDATDVELELVVKSPGLSAYYFADMLSRRAEVGWSTHGHSAVDVNIYGTAGSEALRGNRENTEVGKFLREYLDVDVDAITKELAKSLKSFDVASGDSLPWTGKIPTEEELIMASKQYEIPLGL
ncbi:hypothetical protein B7494_g1428 [Chlorociboria aeruginascens]|nr:hypothetical protein B7494_g1428 [Chlorociboria aeruginascens]